MSDKMRWRYGDTNPVVAAVAAGTVIEIGDLLWQDTNNAKPAAMLPDSGQKTVNQEEFVAKFLGVAMTRSRVGDTAPVRVATTGVFESDCPSETFELGNLMGPTSGTGTALVNQQAVKVAASRYAIGRVAKRQPIATTCVLVDVRSTVMCGGVSGGICSGTHSGSLPFSPPDTFRTFQGEPHRERDRVPRTQAHVQVAAGADREAPGEALRHGELQAEDFSLRELAEATVGAEWVKRLDPRSTSGVRLLEAGDAVDVTAFSNIAGQIVYSRILQAYTQEGVASKLVATIPTRFDGEKYPSGPRPRRVGRGRPGECPIPAWG